MLETEIKKLTDAVLLLNETMSGKSAATAPVRTSPQAPDPTADPVAQPTHAPVAPVAQTAPAPVGVTLDDIKLKASRLAQLMGPQAGQISAHLQTLGAQRLSGLVVENYPAFSAWLDSQLAGR